MSTITKEFTKEQLQQIEAAAKEVMWPVVWSEKKAREHFSEKITPKVVLELARIALASLEAEKVILYRERNPYNGMTTGWLGLTEQEYEFIKDNASENAEFRTVYTAPPAPVSVPDLKPVGFLFVADDGAVAYSPADWPMEGFNLIVQIYGDVNACRAAMLQGADGNSPVIPDAEPVTNRDELPEVVLHMGQAMSVFEALKKEVLYEHVRHAELGAMGAVNVQVWTSVLGGTLQYETSNGGCTLRVTQAAPQQEVKS
ncbi:TPA: hypothetical protein QCI25_002596 [Enterobacter ludwigii]|nr:hypothetical protein [Enterobacter ludwigii]